MSAQMMPRKRARVGAVHSDEKDPSVHGSGGGGPRQFALHSDQRLIGVSGKTMLVATGERHVQVHTMGTHGSPKQDDIGKLVPFQSEHMVLANSHGGGVKGLNGVRYYVAYPRQRDTTPTKQDRSRPLRVFDGETANFHSVPLPRYPAHLQIADAFIDDYGRRIVLVDADCSQLWCWNGDEVQCLDGDQSPAGCWTSKSIPYPLSRASTMQLWSGRFGASPLLGECFVFVSIAQEIDRERSQVLCRVNLSMLDCSDNWKTIYCGHTMVAPELARSSGSIGEVNLKGLVSLSPCCRWVVIVCERPSDGIICIPLEYQRVAVKHVSTVTVIGLDARGVDIAWNSDVFSVLLNNGIVRLFQLPTMKSGRITAVKSEDTEQTVQIDFNPVASQTTPASRGFHWNKLVWLSGSQVLLASFGPNVVEIAVELIARSACDGAESLNTAPACGINPASSAGEIQGVHRRRRHRMLQPSPDTLEEELTIVLQSQSPSMGRDFLQLARLLLCACDPNIIDMTFTLIAIIHHRILVNLGISPAHDNTAHDTQLQLALMEMVIAELLPQEYCLITRTATLIMRAPAFTSRSHRRQYYADIMQFILRVAETALVPNSVVQEKTTQEMLLSCFGRSLKLSLDKIRTLLGTQLDSKLLDQVVMTNKDEIVSFFGKIHGHMMRSEWGSIISIAQRVCQQSQENEKNEPATKTRAVENIVLMMTAYWMVSRCLGGGVAVLDVAHFLHSVSGCNQVLRTDFVARFIIPWNGNFNLITQNGSSSAKITVLAGEFAAAAECLDQLVTFCMQSDSRQSLPVISDVFGGVRALSRRAFDRGSRTQRAVVALQTVDRIIGDMCTELRHINLVPQNNSLTVASTSLLQQLHQTFDTYVKQIYAFTSTSNTKQQTKTIDMCDAASWGCNPSIDQRELEMRGKMFRMAASAIQFMKLAVDDSSRGQIDMEDWFRDAFLMETLWDRTDNSADTEKTVSEYILFIQQLYDSTREGNEGKTHAVQTTIRGHVATMIRVRRQKHNPKTHPQMPLKLRAQIIRATRTLAMLMWCIWVRDRSVNCLQLLGHERDTNNRSDDSRAAGQLPESSLSRKTLGSIAASCALQLSALSLFRTDSNDIPALQLSLLQTAAEFDPHTTARVVAWQFSSDRIHVRHLKRYNSIQAVLNATSHVWRSKQVSLDELRWHIGCMRENVYKHLKGTRHESMLRSIDEPALWDCCALTEFQRVAWALLQKRFVTTSSGDADEVPSSRKHLQNAFLSRPSTIEGLISRQEVIQLLKEQRTSLDRQVQQLLLTNEREPLDCSHVSETKTTTNAVDVASTVSCGRRDAQRRYQISDLSARYHSEDAMKKIPSTSTSDISARNPKQSSSQKVLTLLQLRKHQDHSTKRRQSSPGVRAIPLKAGSYSQPKGGKTTQDLPAGDRTPPLPQGRRPYDQTATAPSREEPYRGRVFPLQHAIHATESTSMIILTANASTTRSIPIASKQFHVQQHSAAKTQRTSLSDHSGQRARRLEHVPVSTQATEMRTTSCQTEQNNDSHTMDDSINQEEIENVQSTEPRSEQLLRNEGTKESTTTTTEMGVQCHSALDAARPPPFEYPIMAERFPIMMDLRSGQRKPFLYVAPIASTALAKDTESTILIDAQHLAKCRESYDEIEHNASSCANSQSVSHHTLNVSLNHSKSEESNDIGHKDSTLTTRERRRQVYRLHFEGDMVTKAPSTSTSSTDTFAALKTEMSKMTRRLLDLENCAADIEADFKVSHQKLEKMENHRDRASRVLRDVEVAVSDSVSGPGCLAQRATEDMHRARRLLDQIEQAVTGQDGKS